MLAIATLTYAVFQEDAVIPENELLEAPCPKSGGGGCPFGFGGTPIEHKEPTKSSVLMDRTIGDTCYMASTPEPPSCIKEVHARNWVTQQTLEGKHYRSGPQLLRMV